MTSSVQSSNLARCLAACAVILMAGTASADEGSLSLLLPSLQQGGYVLVLRHGATDAQQSDVYPLNYKDMTMQRQLSERGRDVARQMGVALAVLGIPIGTVITSRLNRAVETGRLVARKDVTRTDELNDSTMGSPSAMAGSAVAGKQRYATALRQLVATRPEFHTNTLIVTHKTNIQDAFGKEWADINEGECLLFRPADSANPRPVARIEASEWIAIARPR